MTKLTRCEQFIVGNFKGHGSTPLRSEKLGDVLSPENWRHLAQLGGDVEAECKKRGVDHFETRTILWDDKVVAYSFLKPTRDERYDRRGAFNHTILVPIESIINGFNIDAKISPLFARNLEEPPKNPLPPFSVDI